MAALDLAATMDAMADVLVSDVTKRVYPWPSDSIAVPCIVIGYPDITFDFTFAGGSDEAEFPVWYIAGKVSDRNTRDELSRIVAGSDSVKAALDGNLDGAVNSAYVRTGEVEQITVGGVDYAALKFLVEIIS